MKLELKILPLLFLSLKLFAFQVGDLNFQGGAGLFTSRGVVGFSADKFLTTNHAVSLSTGVDIIGPVFSVGWKYFDNSIQKTHATNTFLDKCLFLFDCDVHPYFGISGLYSSATNIEFSGSEGQRNYKSEEKFLALAILGFRDVFTNKVTLDLELSYRTLISGGNVTQLSGDENPDDIKYLQSCYKTLGIGLAIGYLF